MSWLWRLRVLGVLTTVVAGASSACNGGGPAPRHTTLATSLDGLREAFNADSGKVRAIFLAAPT